MTPDEIELLFQSKAQISTSSVDNNGVTPNSEKSLRIAKLKEVLETAQQYRLSQSDGLDLVAEKLGDGSRDVSWRIPLGASGVLDFFLDIVSEGSVSRQPLRIHALRVIGNSCADTDENRARVVDGNHLTSIVGLLADDTLLPFVIPVLYNICVDYDPAQLQACKAGLSSSLINIIAGPRLSYCQTFLNIIGKILSLLVGQEPEASLADPTTPIHLLSVATSPTSQVDGEDFCALVSVALAYLTYERFQEEMITRGAVPVMLTTFSDSYTRFELAELDPDDAAQLKQIRDSFVQIMADISGHTAFSSTYPLSSPVVQTMQKWLEDGRGYTNLKTAACVALGNLSRSDEKSISLIHEHHIHSPLINLLSKPYSQSETSPPSQLLHAILSFLKNLAIPPSNKPVLGTLLDQPVNILPRLWMTTDTQPQVQFAAVSLTRLLLFSCPTNVKRLCAPLSSDPSSPAHNRSNLTVLMDLFSRTDAEPTKLEAARATAAVCRVLHSTPVPSILPTEWARGDDAKRPKSLLSTGTTDKGPSPDEPQSTSSTKPRPPEQSRREAFYAAHLDISSVLTHLLTQPRFPTLRSEALFVYALMSRSSDGTGVIMRALEPVEACRALVEAVTGRDMVDGRELGGAETGGSEGEASAPSEEVVVGQEAMDTLLSLEPQQADPKQAAGMARVDRENGLVLVAEVLRDRGNYLTSWRRGVFEDMLRTGGEMVLHERNQENQ